MAVTFRSQKGAPLTHDELDQNFREYFYSSSFIGPIGTPQGINIYRLSATNATSSIYFPTAVGNNYAIQIKSGANNISSSFLTGSDNFKYDFDNNHFSVSGSAQISGSLTVLGKITAREVVTLITSSQILVSGSTRFGDSFDDTHQFEGLMNVSNGITGSLSGSVEGVAVRNFSQSISSRTTALELFSSSLDNTYATDAQLNASSSALTSQLNASSSALIISISSSVAALSQSAKSTYLLNTTDTFTGDLTVAGNVFVNGTGSFAIIQSITGSAKYIGDSFIVVNNNTPVERYAGLSVYDSGSNTTASLQFDGQTNDWFYEYNDGAVDYGAVLFGPEYSSKGTPTYPTNNTIQKGTGTHHLANSNITDNGSTVSINGVLSITGISNVSASIATLVSSSGASNVSITNNTNNRILTATGTDVLNGESNLTFDGSTLSLTGGMTVSSDATINGTLFSKFTSSDTDINGLIGGTNNGTLIKGLSSGHFVIGLQEDGLTDSFAIIGGGGDYYSTSNYDKLIFKVSGSGDAYVGGNTFIDGNLTVDGIVSASQDIIAYASSDERLKDNITPISNALYKINQIGGYEFDWNDNSEHSGHDVGVIAQEIEKVLPEVVTERKDGYLAVRYEKIVALLIQAVKEQQLQIDELKSKL